MSSLRAALLRVPSPIRRIAITAGGLGLGAGAFALAARGVDPDGLAAALTGVHGWWLVAAAVANAVTIVSQGLAWQVGLAAGGMPGTRARHAIAATWVGKAGNQLLPGKVGEVLRVAMIRSHLARDHREVSRVVGSLAAQRILNMTAMFLVVALTACTISLPVSVPGGRWAPLAALTTLAALVAGATWMRRGREVGSGPAGTLRTWGRRFADGAGVLRPGGAAGRALGLHLLGVLGQVLMMASLLRAFDVAAGVTAPLLIIVLFGLAGAVPAAPGGAGLNQAALVSPLGAVYGVSPDTALAFSIGLQATILVVAVAGGMLATVHHRLSRPVRTAIP